MEAFAFQNASGPDGFNDAFVGEVRIADAGEDVFLFHSLSPWRTSTSRFVMASIRFALCNVDI